MAATTAVTLALGETTYGIYQNAQQAKAAKKAQQAALASRPDPKGEGASTTATAITADMAQRKRTASAQGFGSTVLTGGQGVQAPPPATKTLLGL